MCVCVCVKLGSCTKAPPSPNAVTPLPPCTTPVSVWPWPLNVCTADPTDPTVWTAHGGDSSPLGLERRSISVGGWQPPPPPPGLRVQLTNRQAKNHILWSTIFGLVFWYTNSWVPPPPLCPAPRRPCHLPTRPSDASTHRQAPMQRSLCRTYCVPSLVIRSACSRHPTRNFLHWPYRYPPLASVTPQCAPSSSSAQSESKPGTDDAQQICGNLSVAKALSTLGMRQPEACPQPPQLQPITLFSREALEIDDDSQPLYASSSDSSAPPSPDSVSASHGPPDAKRQKTHHTRPEPGTRDRPTEDPVPVKRIPLLRPVACAHGGEPSGGGAAEADKERSDVEAVHVQGHDNRQGNGPVVDVDMDMDVDVDVEAEQEERQEVQQEVKQEAPRGARPEVQPQTVAQEAKPETKEGASAQAKPEGRQEVAQGHNQNGVKQADERKGNPPRSTSCDKPGTPGRGPTRGPKAGVKPGGEAGVKGSAPAGPKGRVKDSGEAGKDGGHRDGDKSRATGGRKAIPRKKGSRASSGSDEPQSASSDSDSDSAPRDVKSFESPWHNRKAAKNAASGRQKRHSGAGGAKAKHAAPGSDSDSASKAASMAEVEEAVREALDKCDDGDIVNSSTMFTIIRPKVEVFHLSLRVLALSPLIGYCPGPIRFFSGAPSPGP